MAQAFIGLPRESGIEFEPGHIEAERQVDDSRPDLTIHDSDGRVRVFVENKFWAALTDAQPVTYLKSLPENPLSALVFVVSEQRVHTVWRELRERCGQAELEWEGTFDSVFQKGAYVNRNTLMIVSWKVVLERLLDGARSSGNDTAKDDILKLQGLTGRMDVKALLPLREDELTNQETALRLVNYIDLIETIRGELKDQGVADKSNAFHQRYNTGGYLLLRGEFRAWLRSR